MGKDKELLEEAFGLIQQGNEHVETKDHWKAADCFARAQTNLAQLLAMTTTDLPAPPQKHPNKTNNNQEMQKIAELYHQQAVEYLKKGRKSLLQALEQEMAHDGPVVKPTVAAEAATAEGSLLLSPVPNTDTSRLLHDLSPEDATHRLNLFGRLFAKELRAVVQRDDAQQTVEEQESHLEARLAQLSQSLPRSVKSEQERMRDLNRGLARLGLEQVGDSSLRQRTGRLFGLMDKGGVVLPKSEFEQVAEIIAQAKDEVAFNNHLGDDGMNNDAALAEAAAAGRLPEAAALLDSPNLVVEDDDIDESVVDEEDLNNEGDSDAELTPEICRDFHNRLAAAQASLSELVALFEEDAAGDAAIEFDQARGKMILRDARLLLRQVAQKWSEC